MPGDTVTVLLVAVTVSFVFICGANDGGALLSLAIRHRGASGVLVLTVLALAVAAGPAVFGLAVAQTFTTKLTGGADGQLTFLVGTSVAIGLVLALTWRGIPTSITLALLGAIAGAAVGLGSTPAWGRLGFVLALGAAAPMVGLTLAFLLGRAIRRLPFTRVARWTSAVQLLAFLGQSLAYAANDGQKMYAVVATTAVAAGHPVALGADLLPVVVIAGIFAAGATVSLRRVGRGATATLVRMRPGHVISAEVSASVAVFGTASLGVPVSMTQATTGGLIGAALNHGPRSIRWQYTTPLVVAWAVTLPAGLVGGLVIGLIVQGVAR
ncbi:inorganic phosphate transporter [Kribbella monticola]|uniref:inorganic phosphate transporter n=1 Tax=Kribbella monticola TaxID=2185285 RepID=UPI001E581C39|nr:inorganic phosphate transporter [Kribbella monticola]